MLLLLQGCAHNDSTYTGCNPRFCLPCWAMKITVNIVCRLTIWLSFGFWSNWWPFTNEKTYPMSLAWVIFIVFVTNVLCSPPLPFPPCYNIYWRVVLVWLFPRWYWTHCSLIAWTGSSGKTLAQHFLRTTTILPLLNLKDITYCVQSFPSDVVLAALSLRTKIKPKFCLLLLSSVALGLLCSTYSFDRNSITIIWLGCGALVS